MPTFPEFDPSTLAQAITTYVASRASSKTAVSQLGRANYLDIVQGWADALAAVQNPSFAHLDTNDKTLFTLVGQGGGQATTPTLLFNVQGSLSVGEWVVQVSDDTVAIADASTLADGPVVGVVTELLSSGAIARIQNSGSYVYSAQDSYSFLPMTPDATYYASAATAGEITDSPAPPSGGFLQELGYAKTQYQFVIALQEPTAV